MSDHTVVLELAGQDKLARDLVAGGVFVPGYVLELNAECVLVLRGPTDEVRLQARVVWSNGTGIGLQLHNCDAEMKQRITALAEGVSADAAETGATLAGRPSAGAMETAATLAGRPSAVAAQATTSATAADMRAAYAAGTDESANPDEAVESDEAAASDLRDAYTSAQTAQAADSDEAAASERLDARGGAHGDDSADSDAAREASAHAAADAATDAEAGEQTAEQKKLAANVHERLRGLTLAQQIKLAHAGEVSERIVLERLYGKAVWEALLRNPRLTGPEVARIARMGALPRPLVEIIVGNGGWLQIPEVRRALLTNPRLGTDQVMRILRLLPKHELKLAAMQTAYPMAVRDAAKRMIKDAGGG